MSDANELNRYSEVLLSTVKSLEKTNNVLSHKIDSLRDEMQKYFLEHGRMDERLRSLTARVSALESMQQTVNTAVQALTTQIHSLELEDVRIAGQITTQKSVFDGKLYGIDIKLGIGIFVAGVLFTAAVRYLWDKLPP